MVQIITGRIGVDPLTGNIWDLTFKATQPIGFSVIQVGSGAPVAAGAPGAAATLGEPVWVQDGTALPAGIWEVESGTVYAGSGGATIRQVIFE